MNTLSRRSAFTAIAGAAAAAAAPSTALAAGEAPSQPEGPRVIEMESLALPVLRDRELVSYLFINVRIEIADGVDLWATRERNHFLRDALVRAAYREQIADPDRIGRLLPAAADLFRAAAVEALGERPVRRVAVTEVYRIWEREAVSG